jgi:hypothetical protein
MIPGLETIATDASALDRIWTDAAATVRSGSSPLLDLTGHALVDGFGFSFLARGFAHGSSHARPSARASSLDRKDNRCAHAQRISKSLQMERQCKPETRWGCVLAQTVNG